MNEQVSSEVTAGYLTAEQLAALLQVSPKSVFRWAIEDASMPALRIGRTVRFPKLRIMRWLNSREQGAGKARRVRNQTPSGVEPIESTHFETPEKSLCANGCDETEVKR